MVSRSEFLRIWKTSGYSTESSNVLDSGLTSFIEEPKTFATEAAFLAEHARLEQLVKAVAPSASVETLYYAAGGGNSKILAKLLSTSVGLTTKESCQ